MTRPPPGCLSSETLQATTYPQGTPPGHHLPKGKPLNLLTSTWGSGLHTQRLLAATPHHEEPQLLR